MDPLSHMKYLCVVTSAAPAVIPMPCSPVSLCLILLTLCASSSLCYGTISWGGPPCNRYAAVPGLRYPHSTAGKNCSLCKNPYGLASWKTWKYRLGDSLKVRTVPSSGSSAGDSFFPSSRIPTGVSQDPPGGRHGGMPRIHKMGMDFPGDFC